MPVEALKQKGDTDEGVRSLWTRPIAVARPKSQTSWTLCACNPRYATAAYRQ
jgi:hypothetical protein